MSFQEDHRETFEMLVDAIKREKAVPSWMAAVEVIGGALVEAGWRPPAPLSDPGKPVLGKFGQGEAAETARIAALRNYPVNAKVRLAVLRVVAGYGDHGVTSDEIAETNRHLHLPSVKPRLIELREGGWVELTGLRRPSVKTGYDVDVYRMTERGREAYERQGPIA